MQISQYVEDILLSLGHPVVEIEIEEHLPKIVELAFKDIKPHISTTIPLTIPYKECTDLSAYKINTVTMVARAYNPNRLLDFQDVVYLSSGLNATPGMTIQDYRRITLLNQVKNTISTDLDFTWVKPKLYVTQNYPKGDFVTVFYIPEYESVEEIEETFWCNLIRRMALALSKIALGRIRGKYTLSSSLYTLDADALLAEGIAERNELLTYLSENTDMVFPID